MFEALQDNTLYIAECELEDEEEEEKEGLLSFQQICLAVFFLKRPFATPDVPLMLTLTIFYVIVRNNDDSSRSCTTDFPACCFTEVTRMQH